MIFHSIIYFSGKYWNQPRCVCVWLCTQPHKHIHIHNGIPFSSENKWTTAIWSNIDGIYKHSFKWKIKVQKNIGDRMPFIYKLNMKQCTFLWLYNCSSYVNKWMGMRNHNFTRAINSGMGNLEGEAMGKCIHKLWNILVIFHC